MWWNACVSRHDVQNIYNFDDILRMCVLHEQAGSKEHILTRTRPINDEPFWLNK